MTNFSWWQDEANKMGLIMCMLCFEMKNKEFMFKDEQGDVWDICLECQAEENKRLEQIFNAYSC